MDLKPRTAAEYLSTIPEPPWPFVKDDEGTVDWTYTCRFCYYCPCSLAEILQGSLKEDLVGSIVGLQKTSLHREDCPWEFYKALKDAK